MGDTKSTLYSGWPSKRSTDVGFHHSCMPFCGHPRSLVWPKAHRHEIKKCLAWGLEKEDLSWEADTGGPKSRKGGKAEL